MKCSLGSSNILIFSSLSHSVLFLYLFSLITEEGFLISPCYSLELCIQMLIFFLFSFAFHFSSFHPNFQQKGAVVNPEPVPFFKETNHLCSGKVIQWWHREVSAIHLDCNHHRFVCFFFPYTPQISASLSDSLKHICSPNTWYCITSYWTEGPTL